MIAKPLSSPVHNRLADEDRAFHDWYRFVLAFPPHLVRQYVQDFNLTPGMALLDPFCGTGTTIVEGKKLGLSTCGFEANPIAAFASRVKTNWNIDPFIFLQKSYEVYEAVNIEFKKSGLNNIKKSFEWKVQEQATLFGLKSLDEDRANLLLRGSISPLPLHRILALLQMIRQHSEEPYRPLHELAVAWILVNGVGNIRFGPEIGVTKPKNDFDVAEAWLKKCESMAEDLQHNLGRQFPETTVCHTDSRAPEHLLQTGSIDAIFTSPPYPNEKDYTRTTRLENVLLGFLNSKKDLRALKENLLRSNTRNVFVSDQDHLFLPETSGVHHLADEIESRRIELEKTSGFERLYHKVTRLYFGGMVRHLTEMKPLLKKGALLGYVVGDQASYFRIPIKTGQILAEAAEMIGYKVVRIDLFRTRIATATKEQLREEVVILQYEGI